MEIVLLILGLPCVILGLFLRHYLEKAKAESTRVPGTIVDYVKKPHRRQRRSTWNQLIQVEGGHCLSLVASNPPSGKVGDQVEVYRKRRDRNQVFVAGSFLNVFPYALVLGGVGLLVAFYFTFRWDGFSLAIAAFVLAQVGYSIYKKTKGLGGGRWQKLVDQISLFSPLLTEDELRKLDRLSRQPSQQLGLKGFGRANRAAGVIMTVAALVGIGVAVAWAQKKFEFIEGATQAPGQIVDSKHSSGSDSSVYYPVVEYRPHRRGQVVRFVGDMGSSHPSWKVGDKITVLYDPDKPQKAIIEDGLWMYFGPLIIGGMALLFLVIGVYHLRGSRGSSPETSGRNHDRKGSRRVA